MWRGAVLKLAPLMLGGAILAGCGSGISSTPTGLKLQREDLIATARGLSTASAEVDRAVAAGKAAWPSVVNGLTAGDAPSRTIIETAAQRASALRLRGIFEESRARTLTGPASGLVSEFRRFCTLSSRGWALIRYAAEQVAQGPSSATGRFAAANVALYIESVYDANFGLAQIGKQLISGYSRLGGAAAFGSSLTEAEVEQLAGAYSEQRDRLHPHVGVKLGS